MYKPGTDYTVTAIFPGSGFTNYTSGIGDNLAVKGSGIAEYSDGTTGGFVDMPGWVVIQGTNDLGNNRVDGTTGFNGFAAWGGDCRVESADSLGNMAGGATYTISAMINGGVADGPLAFYLLAGGVAMTPSSSVEKVVPVNDWQLISRTFDADAIADHVGQPMTIVIGVQDENDIGGRMIWDNITLEVDNLMNPSPAHGGTVMVDENLELSWNNLPSAAADSNDVDVWVDVWFGTEPNELHPAYDMTLVVDAGENTEAVIVDASEPDTYYWRINSYIYGADNINDSNMIEGSLWLFYAVEDFAPTVEIVTLDQMTWSGEGVPLDATVTDDAASALTIEWSADLPDGISAAFNPGNDVADTTVTLTKVPYSTAKIVNAGFENPVLADGAWDDVTTGWSSVGDGVWIGRANPGLTGTDYPGYGGIAPEGDNVGISGNSEGEGGLAQVLTETLASDTTYELTVEVGNIPFYTWGGYKVQLLAGGTVLAEDDNSLTIAEDTFETSTVTFDSTGVAPALVGEPLEIRLLVIGPGEYTEVNFDDVRLTADPPFPVLSGVETVTMTVAVSDEANPTPDTASIEIDVYDDACQMAKFGEGKSAATDFNANCITALEDLAVIAAAWLDDYASTGPLDR